MGKNYISKSVQFKNDSDDEEALALAALDDSNYDDVEEMNMSDEEFDEDELLDSD
jgi:hypothetical protein